ncbi:immunity protein YezG family protein [Staphylococcus aureus]
MYNEIANEISSMIPVEWEKVYVNVNIKMYINDCIRMYKIVY